MTSSVAPVEREQSRALLPPLYKFGSFRQGITGTEQQPTPAQLVTDGFASAQAIAARAVANRFSDIELRVERRTMSDAMTAEWEVDDGHPLQALIDRPNPVLSRRQLLKLTSYWLTQTGEAFWLVVTNGVGAPRELWPMSPRNVEKVAGDANPLAGYIFHGEQGEFRYSADEVIFVYDPDPADPFQGVGVIGPQASDFDASTFLSTTVREHYRNDATPKIVLKSGENAVMPDADQRDAFFADWVNRYNRRGGKQRGTPAWLPTDVDLQELTGMSDLADARAMQEHLRDQIFMANGVPRSIVGDVVDANRAAADTNRLVFDRQAIAPQVGLVCDAITYQLAQPEFGPDIRVAPVPFIQDDEDLRLREERQDLELKVRSINQVRTDRGLEVAEWGELPVGTFGDQPYDPDGFEGDDGGEGIMPPGGSPPPPADEDPEEGGEGQEDRSRALDGLTARVRKRMTAEAQWNRLLQSEALFVPKMRRAVRQAFAAQKAMTLEALRNAPANERAEHSRNDWIDDLFASEDMARVFTTLVTPIHIDAYSKAGENTLAALEVPNRLSFDIAAEKAMRERGAELVTLVNEATKREIRKVIAKGIEDGASADDQARAIRRKFNQFSKHRALRIARTEVLAVTTEGQLAGYGESDIVVGKRWHTALDETVRDSHRATEGQTRRLGEPFMLGDGELAEGPGVAEGGGRLSPGNGINCQCFTTAILAGEPME